ncbi:MAG: serine hydrolase domain-containing protein [Gaiellaceae bacterium]
MSLADALRLVETWPAPNAAVGIVGVEGLLATHGDEERDFRWASVTKLVTALATLVAAEEGVVDLDEPAGPPGASVRHLLAHASGLPFEPGPPLAPPGQRRIYSNAGFEVLADHVAVRADMPFGRYLREAVFEPLGMGPELRGSAASGLWGNLADAVALARELLAPTVVAQETLGEAISVQFPGLSGVLPDVGRFEPNDWGLGFELRDAKPGHWTGSRVSERTFGHFGGSGTFLWVDPERGLACACLTDLDFGEWAKEAWPALSDAVVSAASGVP